MVVKRGNSTPGKPEDDPEAIFAPAEGGPDAETEEPTVVLTSEDAASALFGAVRELPRGTVLAERYTIKRSLGRGAMGHVYLCRDTESGLDVAVKCLPTQVGNDDTEMKMMRDEYRLAQQLAHPRIATYRHLARDTRSRQYVIIMEYAQGETLRAYMRRRKSKLDTSDVVRILGQLAEGLDYAHRKGVFHRDIKPENIIIGDDGDVKILDFGIASQFHGSVTRMTQHVDTSNTRSGTPTYMAPEQWRGDVQGAMTDLYALAVIAYELINGRPPFSSTDITALMNMVLHEAPVRPPALGGGAWKALDRALAKKPEDRRRAYADCEAFAKRFELELTGSFGLGPLRAIQAVRRVLLSPYGVAAGVGIAIAVGAWYWTTNRPGSATVGALHIRTDPPGAEIWYRGQHRGPSPVILRLLEPGSGELRAELSGHEHVNTNLAVIVDRTVEHIIPLQSSYGALRLTSSPTGAVVSINGRRVGTTPVAAHRVHIGPNEVVIAHEGYYLVTQHIEVASGTTNDFGGIPLELRTGGLRVDTTPAGAEIWFRDKKIGTSPVTVQDLPVGEGMIKARAAGFFAVHKPVSITERDTSAVRIALEAATGMLKVISDPPGAAVRFRSEDIGLTPIEFGKTVTGSGLLAVSLEGHYTYTNTVEIRPDAPTLLNVELTPITGDLDVSSLPEGAEVVFRGNGIGRTPVTAEGLKVGPGLLEILSPGHVEHTQSVLIVREQLTSVDVRLHPLPGTLHVRTMPPGASLSLDGERLDAVSPADIRGIVPGVHSLRINREGYREVVRRIDLAPGEDLDVEIADLVPLSGTIEISAEPEDAMIRIGDGDEAASPARFAAVAEGTHHISVSREGYASQQFEVTVSDQETIRTNVTLVPLPIRLTVRSRPSGAAVFLNSKPINRETPATFIARLPEDGENTIHATVELAGYEPSTRKTLRLRHGDEEVVEFDLVKIMAQIDVAGTPIGADVYVGGQRAGVVGSQGLTISNLLPGTHSLTVRKKKYLPFAKDVVLDRTARLDYRLTPEPGAVRIDVSSARAAKDVPKRATLILDGESLGEGPPPFIIDTVSPGTHIVEIRAEGWEPASQTVTVAPGEETVASVTIGPVDSFLTLDLVTEQVDVSLDGRSIEATSRIPVQPGREYEVEAVRAGYRAFREKFTAREGPNVIKVKLRPHRPRM